jgi:hypothetical protein
MSAARFAGVLKKISALGTSGKSVASRHHREDCMARHRKPAAGLCLAER